MRYLIAAGGLALDAARSVERERATGRQATTIRPRSAKSVKALPSTHKRRTHHPR